MNHIETLAKKSSRKQIPKLFKQIDWKAGTTNLDIGGGAYDDATNWLLVNHDILNLVSDPYNRSEEHNYEVRKHCAYNSVDSITIANVLNVIPELMMRRSVLNDAYRVYQTHNCPVYISCYNASGQPSVSECQTCMPLKDYIPEIKSVFTQSIVTVKRGVITIHPIKN